MNILSMQNIRKSFGETEVLKDISLSVSEGQVTAIIGPSGSGKSTLLRCATLLETMDGGALRYLGQSAVRVKWEVWHNPLTDWISWNAVASAEGTPPRQNRESNPAQSNFRMIRLLRKTHLQEYASIISRIREGDNLHGTRLPAGRSVRRFLIGRPQTSGRFPPRRSSLPDIAAKAPGLFAGSARRFR